MDKKIKKEKKAFKDWGVTKFIKKNAPSLAGEILGIAGDLTGVGVLSDIADKINGSDELTPSQKETAREMMELDIVEMQEVTKRWEADAKSDSWLSKNVRPMTLCYLMLAFTILALIDTLFKDIIVRDVWITQFGSMLMLTLGAYFGLREFGKWSERNKK